MRARGAVAAADPADPANPANTANTANPANTANTAKGLGRVTVLRVAARHGRSLWAESTLNGASFYVALPQTQGEHASVQAN